MKTHRFRIAAGLALLACPLWAGDPSVGAAAQALLAGFTYRAPVAAPPGASAGATEPVTRMAAMQVTAPPVTTLREVSDAMAESNLLAPCMLYTKDLASGRQLQALGAPLEPWSSDGTYQRLQARFPLVSLAF